MKKEIKFIGTDNGIICTGRIYLSNVEAAKVEHNKNMLQNAAKELSVQLDCGVEVCELRLIIGLSPSIKDLDKAAEVMKDVVENIAKVIKDMPDLPVADVEEQQDKPDQKEIDFVKEVKEAGAICIKGMAIDHKEGTMCPISISSDCFTRMLDAYLEKYGK